MTPVYVSGCFGMLHPAVGRHGVLVCSTLGDEALNVYRPLVFLAEQFALAGSPTLRLEYYGAGDSAGGDGEPGRFHAWLDGIANGVRWLRQNCGVGPVTLVGLRIGAALAARAACDIENVEALIMLAPMSGGRRFLRELTLRARTTAEIWQTESCIDDGTWFEAHGLRMDQATREALDRLNVADLPCRPAPRALVLDQHGSPAGEMLAASLRALGTRVESEAVGRLEIMLRDPYENAVPHEAFAKAVAWHQEVAAKAAQDDEPGADGMPAPRPGTSPSGNAAEPAGATLSIEDSGEETPVRFGPDGSLFGILTTPARPCTLAPPLLIANTGANPGSGNSRSAVVLARWLAAHGVTSLRMDGAGIGDSAIQTGEQGHPYSGEADRDLRAGVDELWRRFHAPVMLLGMCSGAFHALRGAEDDRRVAGLILVNLQKFVWRPGDSLSVVQRTTFRTTRFYLNGVASARVWRRLMQGEINIGGIGRALAGRAVRRLVAVSDPALRLMRWPETAAGRVRRQMHALHDRAVPILFVLSGNDPGLDEVAEYFGAQGRQLRRYPNVTLRRLEGADHTLSTHWARDALRDLIGEFLRLRWGMPIASDEPQKAGAARKAGSVPPRRAAAVCRPLAAGGSETAA